MRPLRQGFMQGTFSTAYLIPPLSETTERHLADYLSRLRCGAGLPVSAACEPLGDRESSPAPRDRSSFRSRGKRLVQLLVKRRWISGANPIPAEGKPGGRVHLHSDGATIFENERNICA